MVSQGCIYKHIINDYKNLRENIETDTGGQIKIISEDFYDGLKFVVRICAHRGFYAHAEFDFEVFVDLSFIPEVSLNVTCLSHIYHPNITDVSDDGRICLNLLKTWTFQMGLKCILLGLLYLLYEPNPEDPIRCGIYPSDLTQLERNIYLALAGEEVLGQRLVPNQAWMKWRSEHGIGNEILTHLKADYRKAHLSQQIINTIAMRTCPEINNFDTVDAHQFVIISYKNGERLNTFEWMFYYAETCDVKNMKKHDIVIEPQTDTWMEELNPHGICIPWTIENNQTVSETNTPNPTEHSPLSKGLLQRESSLLYHLQPKRWLFFTTRWPIQLQPGQLLNKSRIHRRSMGFTRRASSEVLFQDMDWYSQKHSKNKDDQIILFDPLSLSPCSTIAIVFSYSINESNIYYFSRCWMSPWHSFTNRHSSSSTINIFNQSVWPSTWIVLLNNWIHFLSRIEIYHTCLGYSRPGTTPFSSSWRITEPSALCFIHPPSQTCGQIALFDGWPLWIGSIILRSLTVLSIKFVSYWGTLRNRQHGSYGAWHVNYVFTDTDEI